MLPEPDDKTSDEPVAIFMAPLVSLMFPDPSAFRVMPGKALALLLVRLPPTVILLLEPLIVDSCTVPPLIGAVVAILPDALILTAPEAVSA